MGRSRCYRTLFGALVLLAAASRTYALGGELLLEPIDLDRGREVPIKVYFEPSSPASPVILFSHGLGGSRSNNAYLGKHWAAAGYVAVFLQHPGSDEQVWKSASPRNRRGALKGAVGMQSLMQRAADVPFVIDQLEAWNAESGHPLAGKMNLERIGMSGHSYGAATTLAVAGRRYPIRRTFADDRLDAFLALSPSVGRGLSAAAAFGHLTKPILCMTGTRDGNPIDPTMDPASRQEVFRALPDGEKYQLVLQDGEHFAFGDSLGRQRQRDPRHHPAIQQISLKFWDAYLKGDADAKRWLQSQLVIDEVGLGSADAWEWK